MKRLITALLCIAMIMSLVACGGKDSGSTSAPQQGSSAPATSAPAEEEVYEINYAIHLYTGTNVVNRVEEFAAACTERSGGRLQFKLFPDQILGTEVENMEQLRTGEIQMSVHGDSLTSQYCPELDPTVIPYIFTEIEDVYAFWDGPGGDAIKAALREKGNLEVIALQKRGGRCINTNVPVYKPEDMQGVKLRVPDIATWITIWQELGALPTPIASTEVFTSIQTNVVQGMENPFEDIFNMGVHEIAPYISITNHLYGVYKWCINIDFFNSLPEDLQQIILEEAEKAARYGDEVQDQATADHRKMLEEAGATFIDVDQAAFAAAAQPGIDKVANEIWDPSVKENIAAVLAG